MELSSGKYLCGVCNEGVGRNSNKCTVCGKWLHARSNVKEFVCSLLKNQKILRSVSMKLYHSSALLETCCDGGDTEAHSVACTRSGWKKFCELIPILTSCSLLHKKKDFPYQACVRSEMDTMRFHRLF